MAFFRKKPVVVEAFTFDEVVAEGRAHCAANGIDLNGGMPWSFPSGASTVSGSSVFCARPTIFAPIALSGFTTRPIGRRESDASGRR